MKALKLTLVVAALALAGCLSLNGPKDSGTSYVADAVSPWLEKGEFPGAVSILYKDGVQETACIGYANYEDRRPISLDNVYMQCSQTKGFCGVTIAMLVEEGKLNLDDPVS